MKNIRLKPTLAILVCLLLMIAFWVAYNVNAMRNAERKRAELRQKLDPIRPDWERFIQSRRLDILFLVTSSSELGAAELHGVVPNQEELDKAVSFLNSKLGNTPIITRRVEIDPVLYHNLIQKIDSNSKSQEKD